MIHKNILVWAKRALCCLAVVITSVSATPADYDHSPTIGPAKA